MRSPSQTMGLEIHHVRAVSKPLPLTLPLRSSDVTQITPPPFTPTLCPVKPLPFQFIPSPALIATFLSHSSVTNHDILHLTAPRAQTPTPLRTSTHTNIHTHHFPPRHSPHHLPLPPPRIHHRPPIPQSLQQLPPRLSALGRWVA
jgi:hypothetical protein